MVESSPSKLLRYAQKKCVVLVGLGRHELTVAILAGARHRDAFLRALARGREYRLHVEDARYEHVRVVAPVNLVVLVRNDLAVKRRRVDVHVPALEAVSRARASRSPAGFETYAYSSEPPSVFVCTNARCARSLRLSTMRT